MRREAGQGGRVRFPQEPCVITRRRRGFLPKTAVLDFQLQVTSSDVHVCTSAASPETRLNDGQAGGRGTNREAVSEFPGRVTRDEVKQRPGASGTEQRRVRHH